MTIETICLNATWITFDSIYFKYLVTITTYISITDTDFFKIRLTILCHLVSDYSESKIIIAFLQEAKQIPCIIYIYVKASDKFVNYAQAHTQAHKQ